MQDIVGGFLALAGLYDLDELHEGRLDDYVANLDTLRAADLANKKTYAANHNEASIRELLARFRTGSW